MEGDQLIGRFAHVYAESGLVRAGETCSVWAPAG